MRSSVLSCFVCLPLLVFAQAEDVRTTVASGTTDYTEHLEIDFDDPDETRPPWEDDGDAALFPDASGSGDTDWIPDAVMDVAYYLRQFKFNEFDRRYHAGRNYSGARGFVGAFPTPPLRSLHWEVRDACDAGFTACLRYLHDKLSSVRLRRSDDTVKAVRDNQLSMPDNSTQAPEEGAEGAFESMEAKARHENRQRVLDLDKVCVALRDDDERSLEGFMGPLDRFQWRATASYYMCAFTMKGEPALRQLGEPCDNFAWCLDWGLGPSHGDPRARDSVPFQCARYSFCPDPCCARRLVRSEEECVSSEDNPCRLADVRLVAEPGVAERRPCSVVATVNADLAGMAENRWNTSCACAAPGYHWQARFGFCVDTNECEQSYPCDDLQHEECVNTPGSFACRCRWGWRRRGGRCVRDPTAGAAAAARRGGAELPDRGHRRGGWEVLQDLLVPDS